MRKVKKKNPYRAAMNRLTKIYMHDLEPRIHMKRLPKKREVYGALNFVDCVFTSARKKDEQLFFYKHKKYGLLFCNESMRKRISDRLEANGYTPLEYRTKTLAV